MASAALTDASTSCLDGYVIMQAAQGKDDHASMIILHIAGCIPDELRERGDVGGLVPHDPGLVQRARVSLVRNDRHLLILRAALPSPGTVRPTFS
jgi:hypothetical protein